MARFGIHCPNYPNLTGDDLDAIERLSPSLLVVMQPDFGTIPEIRERISDITIVGRIFGDYAAGWDAWHLPRDSHNLIEYGRFCGRLAEQWQIDILQYRNEPGIDDNDPSWWTAEGYKRLAIESGSIRAGFRQMTNRKLGTVPLSPGHQEDDGLLGAQYLSEEWHNHDVLLLHTYWNRDPGSVDSQWFGQRYKRQLDAYDWDGLWAITEWNRDEPTPPGGSEMASLAADARKWFALFPNDVNFLGAAFFIWRTGAPEFQRLQMFNNDELKAVAKEVNQGGSTMPKTKPEKTEIVPLLTPAGVPGGEATITLKVSGVDGQAKGFVDVEYPLVPGTLQTVYGPNQTAPIGPFGNGVVTIVAAIGPAVTNLPGTVMGAFTLRIVEIENDNGVFVWDGGTFGPFDIEIVPVPTEAPATPVVPVHPSHGEPPDWPQSKDLQGWNELYAAAHRLEEGVEERSREAGVLVIQLIDRWKAGLPLALTPKK